jgi:hypothetical protein
MAGQEGRSQHQGLCRFSQPAKDYGHRVVSGSIAGGLGHGHSSVVNLISRQQGAQHVALAKSANKGGGQDAVDHRAGVILAF